MRRKGAVNFLLTVPPLCRQALFCLWLCLHYTGLVLRRHEDPTPIVPLFTYKNGCGGTISETWRSCTAPILNILPYFVAVRTPIRPVAEVKNYEWVLEPTETEVNTMEPPCATTYNLGQNKWKTLTPPPPPPKIKDGKMARFCPSRGVILDLGGGGGMGVCCSILFCPRL